MKVPAVGIVNIVKTLAAIIFLVHCIQHLLSALKLHYGVRGRSASIEDWFLIVLDQVPLRLEGLQRPSDRLSVSCLDCSVVSIGL